MSPAPFEWFPFIRLSFDMYLLFYAVRGGGKQTDLNDWTRFAYRGGASRSAALVSISSAAAQAWLAWFCVLLFPRGQGRTLSFLIRRSIYGLRQYGIHAVCTVSLWS